MITFDEFEVSTGGRLDARDVTEDVRGSVKAAGIVSGTVLVYSPHTTCCILVSVPDEHVLEALSHAMEALAPNGEYYAHDDLEIRTENLVEDEPANAPAHIAHAFIGKTSECIPVKGGELSLGPDQRILFVELDSSRHRRYFVQTVGE